MHKVPFPWVCAVALLWGQSLLTQARAADARYDTKAPLPPSWQAGDASGKTEKKGDILGGGRAERLEHDKKTLVKRPWYEPRATFGLSVNLPELVAFESYLLFGRYFGLRLFYAPPIPITVRVEMPADLIQVKDNVAIANPAFNVHGQLTYGEHYGAEAMVFPLGGSFFLMGGVSHRKIRLVADAQTPLRICSGAAILAPEPCSDPTTSIETQIQLKAHADVITEATLLRAGLGWFWHIGGYSYLSFTLGAAKPTMVKHNASLTADIVTPAGADAELNSALEQIRAKQLATLRTQTLNATRPVDVQTLPILGLGAGVRF